MLCALLSQLKDQPDIQIHKCPKGSILEKITKAKLPLYSGNSLEASFALAGCIFEEEGEASFEPNLLRSYRKYPVNIMCEFFKIAFHSRSRLLKSNTPPYYTLSGCALRRARGEPIILFYDILLTTFP